MDKLSQMFGMLDLVKTTFDKEYFDAQVAASEAPMNKPIPTFYFFFHLI